MGLFNFLKDQLIDVIEWLDSSNDTLSYRFERAGNEIKMGAKLIVRPGQVAVFVNEGHVADVFESGTYDLYTRNLPILSTLKAWPYGFNSPFKAEVYFFSTRQFTNLKWGTPNPLTLRDPDFGPVRVRAFGSYAIRIADPAQMLTQLIGTDDRFQVDEISDQLRNLIVSGFATWLGRSGIPVLDLASQYDQLGDQIRGDLQMEMGQMGLELSQLSIENISVPPEVEQALDRRSSMGILGDMGRYTQFQTANAIESMAQQPGGSSPALDAGFGMALGQQMANAMGQAQAQPAYAPAPHMPPPPPPHPWYFSRDGQSFGPMSLDQLLQQGISQETYVWQTGMSAWQPASQIPEIATRLGPPPPPMP